MLGGAGVTQGHLRGQLWKEVTELARLGDRGAEEPTERVRRI